MDEVLGDPVDVEVDVELDLLLLVEVEEAVLPEVEPL